MSWYVRQRTYQLGVTAALTETMFEGAANSVWLEASGDGSRRVYERVGFAAEGSRLYLAIEGWLTRRAAR
jgi:hypothetical protein